MRPISCLPRHLPVPRCCRRPGIPKDASKGRPLAVSSDTSPDIMPFWEPLRGA